MQKRDGSFSEGMAPPPESDVKFVLGGAAMAFLLALSSVAGCWCLNPTRVPAKVRTCDCVSTYPDGGPRRETHRTVCGIHASSELTECLSEPRYDEPLVDGGVGGGVDRASRRSREGNWCQCTCTETGADCELTLQCR